MYQGNDNGKQTKELTSGHLEEPLIQAQHPELMPYCALDERPQPAVVQHYQKMASLSQMALQPRVADEHTLRVYVVLRHHTSDMLLVSLLYKQQGHWDGKMDVGPEHDADLGSDNVLDLEDDDTHDQKDVLELAKTGPDFEDGSANEPVDNLVVVVALTFDLHPNHRKGDEGQDRKHNVMNVLCGDLQVGFLIDIDY